jgi:hypothetical protein
VTRLSTAAKKWGISLAEAKLVKRLLADHEKSYAPKVQKQRLPLSADTLLEVGAFLVAIGGDDETVEAFQVFVDHEPTAKRIRKVSEKQNKDKENKKIWNGGKVVLGTLADKLIELGAYNAGHPERLLKNEVVYRGLFTTINLTDGEGRKDPNITGVRALFVDDDEGTVDVEELLDSDAPPSAVVRSRRGPHVYWRVSDCTLENFPILQLALARRFKTDSTLGDLPQVMRLPGFFHVKDPQDPFLVRLEVAEPDHLYTCAEVVEALNLNLTAAKAEVEALRKKRRSNLKPPDLGGIPMSKRVAKAKAELATRRAVANNDKVFSVCCVARNWGVVGDEGVDLNWAWAQRVDQHHSTGTKARYTRDEIAAMTDRSEQYGDGPIGWKWSTPEGNTGRPTIWVGPDEYRVGDEAIAALAAAENIYQRAGHLVTIGVNDEGQAIVRGMKHASLRERLTATAHFMHHVKGDPVETTPPDPVTAALLARGEWPVPTLAGVCSYPVLTPNGEILMKPGYDPETRLYMGPCVEPIMPSDTTEALETLLDPLDDFPFTHPPIQSFSVVISAILSVLARPAIDGPVPLHVFDSNTPGTGKGLLGTIISTIVTGYPSPPAPHTHDEEFRKRVFGVLETGVPISVIDDVKGTLGGGTIDRLLTAWPHYEDRRLGVSENFTFSARCVWLATGVNVEIADHTARRVVVCRLDTDRERPEDRGDFKHPRVLEYVRKQRPELLGADLYLIKNYIDEGSPDQALKPLGSFEAWGLVRNAMVFAGLADPVGSRVLVDASGFFERDALSVLLSGNGLLQLIEQAGEDCKGTRGVSSATINEEAMEGFSEYPALTEALFTLLQGRRPSPDTLGYALRRLRGRVIAGKQLITLRDKRNVSLWCVVDM